MNKIITSTDLPGFDFRNVWELKNPKFHQAPAHSHDALPRYKRRHSGSSINIITNYLVPSRLYGIRKILAWPLWMFIGVLIFGTVYAYQTGSGEMGQIYFTLFFIGLYLLFFIKAATSRLSRWDAVYMKVIKKDLDTHSKPAIIYDGQDMLMANEKIFELIGDRPIGAFVKDHRDQLARMEKMQADAKRAADKEKARLRKEKEDKEFKEALAEVGPLIGSGLKNLVREGGPATRAARAARGLPPRSSFSAPHNSIASRPNYIKIEGYTGQHWETCATGLDNNANYISMRMQKIRKSNPRYTKLRAIDNEGRVVDMG